MRKVVLGIRIPIEVKNRFLKYAHAMREKHILPASLFEEMLQAWEKENKKTITK